MQTIVFPGLRFGFTFEIKLLDSWRFVTELVLFAPGSVAHSLSVRLEVARCLLAVLAERLRIAVVLS